MPTYVALFNWTDQGVRACADTVARAENFAAMVEDVAMAAVEQERLELWIMREIEKGVPLPGLYPPNAETKLRYEAETATS